MSGTSFKMCSSNALYQKHLGCLSKKKKKRERERGIPRTPTKTHYDEIPKSVYLAKVLNTSEH